MATFTVRVELHDADDSDYDTLWTEMKARGFKRRVTSDDGITYKLPPAEYSYDGDITRSDVLKKAKEAAAATGRDYAVLVTESAGRTWSGLEKV